MSRLILLLQQEVSKERLGAFRMVQAKIPHSTGFYYGFTKSNLGRDRQLFGIVGGFFDRIFNRHRGSQQP